MGSKFRFPVFFLLGALVFFSPSFSWRVEENSREYTDLARRARRALEARRWNEAAVVLEEAKRKFRRSPQVGLGLAYLYRELGFYSWARGHAEWARPRMHKDKDWLERELAWIFYRMSLYEEALKSLGGIRERIPADDALEARLFAAKRQYGPALEALDRIYDKSAQVYFWKGWCLWHLGRWEEARRSFEASGISEARQIFISGDAADSKNAWLVLAAAARQAIETPSAARRPLPRLPRPSPDAPSQDLEGWELLERLGKP